MTAVNSTCPAVSIYNKENYTCLDDQGKELKQHKNRGPPYHTSLTKTYLCWWYSAGNRKSTEDVISENCGGMHSDSNQKKTASMADRHSNGNPGV